MSPAKGQTSRFCKNGHNKDLVGRAKNGWCKKCRRESYARRGLTPKQCPEPRKVNFQKPICPRGHEKRVVGVDPQYACLACKKERAADCQYWRDYRRRRACREAMLPDGMLVSKGTALPKLREIRLRAGLTQKEMAARIGCSAGFVCRLEAGTQKAGRVMLRNILDAITETGEGLPKGRYVTLLRALAEAERRGMPTGKMVAEILPETTLRTGSLLRWAERLGLAEKFEGAPPGASGTSKTTWLITDEGRALIEGRDTSGMAA